MKNIKLERQKYAYSCVLNNNKEYKSSVESFGMMVYKNSLISAIANVKANNNPLYTHISNWLKPNNYPLGFSNGDDLLKNLLGTSTNTLMILTDETLRLTDALKEFAKAEID